MTVLVESANGTIASLDGEVVATRCHGNPLDPAWSLPPGAGDAPAYVAWSGTLGASLFAADPRNWIGAGWAAFEERCAALVRGRGAGGRRILWQPHARHVLNDVPTCLRFLAAHPDAPFGIALAPASLLEPSMLAAVEDHFERILVALGSRCELLVLADVAVEEAGERCVPVPLGQGRLPSDAVRRLLERCVPPSTPTVLGSGDLETQLAWLDRLPARAAAPYTGTTPPGSAPR